MNGLDPATAAAAEAARAALDAAPVPMVDRYIIDPITGAMVYIDHSGKCHVSEGSMTDADEPDRPDVMLGGDRWCIIVQGWSWERGRPLTVLLYKDKDEFREKVDRIENPWLFTLIDAELVRMGLMKDEP